MTKTKLTKPQIDLLQRLEKGCEVTFRNDYYTIVDGETKIKQIWPSTFHGLFLIGALNRQDNGNYTISEEGKKLI